MTIALVKADHPVFTQKTHVHEAQIIRKRARRLLAKGQPVTSEQIWNWIADRCPTWPRPDQEQVFTRVSTTL